MRAAGVACFLLGIFIFLMCNSLCVSESESESESKSEGESESESESESKSECESENGDVCLYLCVGETKKNYVVRNFCVHSCNFFLKFASPTLRVRAAGLARFLWFVLMF